MNYTKKELVTVSIAVQDASTYLNSAYAMFAKLLEIYFEDSDSIEWFIANIKADPDRMFSELFGIEQLMKCAKTELDLLTGAKTPQLDSYFNEAKQKIVICNTVRGEVG